MLVGGDAGEQCVVIDSVNFLNNADLDGKAAPPRGAPNVMMAAGGTQLKKIMEDSVILRVVVPRRLEGPVEDDASTARSASRRALSVSVRRTAHELRAAAGRRTPARRAGRQADGASRVSARRRARSDRRRALREHDGGRRRCALVRVPDRRTPRRQRSTSRGRTRRTARSRWMASPAIDARGQHRNRLLVRRTRRSSPASGSRRVSPAIRSDASLFARPCWRRAKRRRRTRCGGRTTRRRRSIRRDDCTIWYVGDYFKTGRDDLLDAHRRVSSSGVSEVTSIRRAVTRPAHGGTTEMTTLSVRIPSRARMAVEPADVRSKVADNA